MEVFIPKSPETYNYFYTEKTVITIFFLKYTNTAQS